jgi:hypothetical protein
MVADNTLGYVTLVFLVSEQMNSYDLKAKVTVFGDMTPRSLVDRY